MLHRFFHRLGSDLVHVQAATRTVTPTPTLPGTLAIHAVRAVLDLGLVLSQQTRKSRAYVSGYSPVSDYTHLALAPASSSSSEAPPKKSYGQTISLNRSLLLLPTLGPTLDIIINLCLDLLINFF